MPEQHVEARKVEEVEEVFDVVFPSGDEPAGNQLALGSSSTKPGSPSGPVLA